MKEMELGMKRESGNEEDRRISSRRVKDVYAIMMKKAREEREKKSEEKGKKNMKMVERRKEKRDEMKR